MLRTFSIACKSDIAFPAHARERVLLVETEVLLLLRAGHLLKIDLHDVSEPVFRVDEMIAGVEVSGMLHREGRAARFAKYTQTRIHPEPALECDIEHLYKVPADVFLHPLVEDFCEEPSVSQG